MYIVFRRYIDAEVMAYLLGGVRGVFSYCLRHLRRREPATAAVHGDEAGTQASNRRATAWDEPAASISVQEIIEGDPILQV